MTNAEREELDDIASRLFTHLERFEADPVINAEKPVGAHMGLPPYFKVWVARFGRSILVRYVSFQTTTRMTRERAQAYLAWLDAGNVGTHHKFEAAAV